MGFAFARGIGFTGRDVFTHSYFLDQNGRGGCRKAIGGRLAPIFAGHPRRDLDARGPMRTE